MTKRMLIDATHAEETRVVVLDGSRLEDFDVETAAKKQLKGNIYLAKIVRVEPSLQAAFVEYGGGRHGFLAFGEIHPDYYQIPVADRQRLLELQEAEARAEEEADDAAAAADEAEGGHGEAPIERQAEPSTIEHAGPGYDTGLDQAPISELVADEDAFVVDAPTAEFAGTVGEALPGSGAATDPYSGESAPDLALDLAPDLADAPFPEMNAVFKSEPEGAFKSEPEAVPAATEPPLPLEEPGRETTQAAAMAQDFLVARDEIAETESVFEAAAADSAPDSVAHEDEPFAAAADHDAGMAPLGFEANASPTDQNEGEPREDGPREDEPREARAPARFMRSYKIQEVIRRRQILLVQVVKEERGSKGAALTTYISLAGRFSVLMPNSPRGGGISRKITSTADRRRLKEVTSELQIPRGMGLIVRTAGANRPKAEIIRDCEYLLELWDSIRDTTMASMAPALIHEEANLIRRAIRDNYSRDVEEVLVDGEAGWRAARDFMRMLMPAHARKVVLWNDPQPLFARNQVEAQLDAMLVPTVQLKSGGYLVINQTEALVAIDVNSGRSTRERGIEETALKTNLEAADEVARQLRLRDLAGLIVIDFIDMESRRNNAAVEKRMKDALKDDRARIQLGSISHFGLMEMSRQRLRPSLAETSFTPCPHCGGTGHVRSTETSALAVLRAIEDEGAKRRAAEIVVHVAGAIALYVLNHKRVRIAEIEARYGMTVAFAADESLLPPETRIEKVRAQVAGEGPSVVTPIPISTRPVDDEDDVAEEDDVEAIDEPSEAQAAGPAAETDEAPPGETPAGETAEEAERSRKRRRRRRGGRREEGEAPGQDAAPGIDPALAEQPDLPMPAAAGMDAVAVQADDSGTADTETLLSAAEEAERGRKRGRRGGRRRRRDAPDGETTVGEATEAAGPEARGESEVPSSFEETARPASPAPYAGPTPADPFGGGVFDIYDAMEQAEARAAAVPVPVSPEPPPLLAPHRPEAEAAAAEATVPLAVADPEPVEAESELAPEPVASEPEPALPLPEPGMRTPEPVTVAEPVAASAPAITETPPAPPILIGADDSAVEKKRGWWRR